MFTTAKRPHVVQSPDNRLSQPSDVTDRQHVGYPVQIEDIHVAGIEFTQKPRANLTKCMKNWILCLPASLIEGEPASLEPPGNPGQASAATTGGHTAIRSRSIQDAHPAVYAEFH